MWDQQKCDCIVEMAKSFSNRAADDYLPLMWSQRRSATFLSLICNKRVTSLVEISLVGIASGLQIEFFLGHPGTNHFSRHQDNFYAEAGSQAFMSSGRQ